MPKPSISPWAAITRFTTTASYGIPAIYFNDWPDRYIHTDRDLPANLDPTKLGRVAFLAAATGWALANVDDDDVAPLWQLQRRAALRRAAATSERSSALDRLEAENLARFAAAQERSLLGSMASFGLSTDGIADEAGRFFATFDALVARPNTPPRRAGAIYRRNPAHPGTTSTFGYAWLPDHLGAERAASLRLPEFTGLWGGGGDYSYEALNFVDGRRTTVEIRDALAAIYGPVPLELVEEYLLALRDAGLLLPPA